MTVQSLPRSIRWRIQLGLYDVPPAILVVDESSRTTAGGSCSTSRTTGMDIHNTKNEEASTSLEHVAVRNRKNIWLQRSSYETLMKEYAQEFEAAHHLSCDSPSGEGSLDPLSIFALEAEAKERRGIKMARCSSSGSYCHSSSNESLFGVLDDLSGSCNSSTSTNSTSTAPSVDADTEEADELGTEADDTDTDEADDSDEQDIEEILATITKDLNRLQPQHGEFYTKYRQRQANGAATAAVEERRGHLTELLYFFAREHPALGYHQGMHELASLLLLVAELDVYREGKHQPSISSSPSSPSSSSSKGLLLDEKYIRHDTYAVMESLFVKVGPCYAGDSDNLDVVSKLRFVSGDDKFLRYLVSMDVAPELYCARWVRLLFSREVTHWKIVLPLWDLFFDLTSRHPSVLSMGSPSSYTRPGLTPVLLPGRIDWVTVLETSAASLIWMHRKEFLDMNTDDGFCALVNMPPMNSVSRLMATILSTMRRLQHNQKPQRTGIEGMDPEGLITRSVVRDTSGRLRSVNSANKSFHNRSFNNWSFSGSRSLKNKSPLCQRQSPAPSLSPNNRRSASPMRAVLPRASSFKTSLLSMKNRSLSPGPQAARSRNVMVGAPTSATTPATIADDSIGSTGDTIPLPSRNLFRSLSNSDFFKNASAMLPSVPVLRTES